jgi:putative endonuclease
MNFVVYVLESEVNKKHYIGHTADLEQRIKRHNSGFVRASKRDKPFKTIYTEAFNTKSEAMAREKYLKSGWGREFLKRKLISVAQ